MGNAYLIILFALWMILIFVGMVCIAILGFRFIKNEGKLSKVGDKSLIITFVSKLPKALKILWWVILISAIAVALINTLCK